VKYSTQQYYYYRICPALKKAKITDPDSQEGIDFCTEKCPYPDCIAVTGTTLSQIRQAEEKHRAKQLQKKGMSNQEIARRIGKSARTVDRYLKK